jgi:demethylmenaquinone methyltransferase/2-methoxy-6-polyprenyl-1,4-benzoquinol methylase
MERASLRRRRTEPRAWDEQALSSPHAQTDKADRVRRMFNAIAPTYELINRVFSLGRDGAWRRRAVRLAGVTAEDSVLDIACGTGDLLRAFAAAPDPPRRLVGCDFARDMLLRAAGRRPRSLHWCECDALTLPFADETFTVVSCAFGIRNFQALDAGLAEMHRVLAPRGRAVILEFTRPTNPLLRAAYEVYSRRLMPVGARLISRDGVGAYRYLPESVVSFSVPAELCRRLEQAGFAAVVHTPLTAGVVTVYVAYKNPHG